MTRRRILLINPNTSTEMTLKMLAQARKHVEPDIFLDAITGCFGSAVIASRTSYTIAAHAALDTYTRYSGAHPDAVVLCCFGDPGLEALKEIAAQPVVGLAEASIRAAQARDAAFAIITIGKAWIPILEERLTLAKARERCIGTYAIEGTGRDVYRNPREVTAELDQAAVAAVEAGAKVIILGGGALSGLADQLTARAGYIDCLQAAMNEAGAYCG